MKTNKAKTSDPLSGVMNESGLDVPSGELSRRLVDIAIRSYRKNYAIEYRAKERIGKTILTILLLFNIWILWRLVPFSIPSPVFICPAALAVGFAVIIRMNKNRLNV